ncbi:LuxR family transcriptional regulator [Blastococcus jejuensis]|uniref:LuxR family transcriptional regulator n=1 Tax=Blastococcus jejuensis TaxID=351224 RepID=A0ABP6PKD5_9ACTN
MLQGRDVEQARVRALLDDARVGRGGALVLRGQPGVGKSALLADAEAGARAAGLTVLLTRGVESESPLPFAALQRLLRPVMDCAEGLPSLQARALRTAFGEGEPEGGAGDRFLVYLAALSLLAEAGERTPVLAVVDDAHWLDDASAAALLFVARRLQAEDVGLVFAARTGDVRTFDSGDLPVLDVGAIDRDAAGALLSERAGVPVPAAVRDALLAGTGGNPLALVELAGALTVEQLAGTRPLPDRLPLTEGVERAFLDRYRRLPPEARTVLLVAAADDSGRTTTVRSGADALGAGEAGFEDAERSGLLSVRGGTCELRHPLVRSAVYDAATSTERRRVHRALAAVLTDVDPDRRAWHLAASVDTPDADIVDELERAAERALMRGGREAASAAFERAAELASDAAVRAALLHRAATSAWLGARPPRARALADAALALDPEPLLRADVRLLLAHLEFHQGSLDVAHGMLLEAAAEVAPHDRGRTTELAMLAAALAAFGARSTGPVGPIDLLPAAGPGASVRELVLGDLIRGLDAVSRADWIGAAPPLRRAVGLADELVVGRDEDLLLNLGIAAWPLGDSESALRLQDRLLAHARDTGAVVMIVHALTRRSLPELATGRWATAASGAEEALALADNSGQPVLAAWPAAVLALLAVFAGDGSAADEHLARVERIAGTHSLGIVTELVLDLSRWARGVREIGEPSGGMHHFERMSSASVSHLAALDRIEAAVHAGRPETARAWVAELESYAAGTGAPWAAAIVEHGRALLANGPAVEEHFERALEAHGRSLWRPARGRTELAYGSHLRRSRRRVDARAHLRAALEVFEDIGAGVWTERARQELRASGETARRREATDAPALTPSERQIAGLVREGLSNRDIAARLFVSPRTVDFHLRNVFAKVGVTSRTELAAQLTD